MHKLHLICKINEEENRQGNLSALCEIGDEQLRKSAAFFSTALIIVLLGLLNVAVGPFYTSNIQHIICELMHFQKEA